MVIHGDGRLDHVGNVAWGLYGQLRPHRLPLVFKRCIYVAEETLVTGIPELAKLIHRDKDEAGLPWAMADIWMPSFVLMSYHLGLRSK